MLSHYRLNQQWRVKLARSHFAISCSTIDLADFRAEIFDVLEHGVE